jgi:hypothetical protein
MQYEQQQRQQQFQQQQQLQARAQGAPPAGAQQQPQVPAPAASQPFSQAPGAAVPQSQPQAQLLQQQGRVLPPQLQPRSLQPQNDAPLPLPHTTAPQAPLAGQVPMPFHLQSALGQHRSALQQQQHQQPQMHMPPQMPLHMQHHQAHAYQQAQQQLFAASRLPGAPGAGLGLTPGLGLGMSQFGLGMLGGAAGTGAAVGSPGAMGPVPPVSMGAVGGVGLGMQQMLGVGGMPGAHGPPVQQYGQPGLLQGQQGAGLNQPYGQPYGQPRRSSVADPLEAGQEQDMEHMIKFLGM